MRLLLHLVNWSSYNKSLVRRGQVILDFDVLDSWYSELERMNDGKRGAQYRYPDSFIQTSWIDGVYMNGDYGYNQQKCMVQWVICIMLEAGDNQKLRTNSPRPCASYCCPRCQTSFLEQW
jgi:hypothetical protein